MLKTLAVRTGSGYALVVIPASRRLDLHLARVLGHDTVTFAAGSQTESVKIQTQELFGTGGFTTVSLVKQPERGSDDRIW